MANSRTSGHYTSESSIARLILYRALGAEGTGERPSNCRPRNESEAVDRVRVQPRKIATGLVHGASRLIFLRARGDGLALDRGHDQDCEIDRLREMIEMDDLRDGNPVVPKPLEERGVDSEILSDLLGDAEEERVVASVESVHASRDAVRSPSPRDRHIIGERASDQRLDEPWIEIRRAHSSILVAARVSEYAAAVRPPIAAGC